MKGNDTLVLFGGQVQQGTEIVNVTEQDSGREGFNIRPGRRGHCSIQTGPGVLVLTGGTGPAGDYMVERTVTEYRLEGEWRDLVDLDLRGREMPQLLTGRYGHACGGYKNSAGTQVTTVSSLEDVVIQ